MGFKHRTGKVPRKGDICIAFCRSSAAAYNALRRTGIGKIRLQVATFSYLQNAKKGDFARHKMKGKRAIELGSGMGLGGFAIALLGCNTVVTDTKEVLSLLQRNQENNLAPAALRGAGCSMPEISC